MVMAAEKFHLPVLQDEPEADEPIPEPPPLVLPPGEPPRTRAECLPGGTNTQRPCPWFMCKHNLAREVGRYASESCVLDVADRHGATLEEVGEMLNLTRERIRQIEQTAMRRLHKILRSRPDFHDR